MFFDQRIGRINALYSDLASAAGVPAGVPRDPELLRQASEIIDGQLHAEAIPISAQVWASELAGEAEKLLASVAAGLADLVSDASSLAADYNQARMALYQAKLAESGQDVCRSCGRARPATDVKLVLIHTVTAEHLQDYDRLKHDQEFAILCGHCRVEKPPVPESLRQVDGPPIVAEVFTRIYEAVEVERTFWVKVKDEGKYDDYATAVEGFTSQPRTSRTGPPSIIAELAERFGLPPALDVVGTGADAKVITHIRVGYKLDLLTREECCVELSLPPGPQFELLVPTVGPLAFKTKRTPLPRMELGPFSW